MFELLGFVVVMIIGAVMFVVASFSYFFINATFDVPAPKMFLVISFIGFVILSLALYNSPVKVVSVEII